MTSTTSTFEIAHDEFIGALFQGLAWPDPLPTIEVAGPVDGIWTITAPNDDFTKEELDSAVAILLDVITRAQNYDTLREKIAAAIPSNRDFLNISAPTAEEIAAQVQELTRQTNALLIIRVGDWSDISGT